MAVIMYWNSTHKPRTDIPELPDDFRYNRTPGILASLGVGFISSMFGIGGGVIHVLPAVYLLGFPVRYCWQLDIHPRDFFRGRRCNAFPLPDHIV